MREHGIDKQAVREAFNRAAHRYDSAAALQRAVCHQLASFAARHRPVGPIAHVLDAGCGTGYALDVLANHFPSATTIALDFAPAMLARLERPSAPGSVHAVCADVEALPLADASIDAVWSSLALQWCEPTRALDELARVLRPGGSAWIATLGPRTLSELREAFTAVDDAAHVIDFHPMQYWLDRAVHAGLSVLACDNCPEFALGTDLRALLRDIKAIGAHTVGPRRRHAPLGKAAWRTLQDRYERHRRVDGMLPATYDVILITLQKPGFFHDR